VSVERFDHDYFDRWYRKEGFGSRARLDRKVRYAVAVAEYLLDRPVRSVLDVGCGEGAWGVALRRMRPRARYVGIDPSRYAVGRYGRRRRLHLGGLGDLDRLGLQGQFDLIVCVDVIAYVKAAEIRRGLEAISSMLSGVALIEVFTSADRFEGDLEGYHRRHPNTYRRWFTDAGLVHIGPNLWCGQRLWPTLSSFERGP
jgi:SAM-dependent methyltransferase